MKTFVLFLFPCILHSQIITTICGLGAASFSGDGGQAVNATLYSPNGITSDRNGNLYICDAGNNRIRKIDSTGIIHTIAGTGVAGFSGDGGPAVNAEINVPVALVLSYNREIYFCEQNSERVRKINSSRIIETIAGNGAMGYDGDGGPATQASLFVPEAVTLDSVGNIYIGDWSNNVIRKVNTAGIISTIAGTGIAGYSGDGGPAILAQLHNPAGLVFDKRGNLLFCDETNNVVRKISPAGIISTIVGNGVIGYSGDGGPAVHASINGPGFLIMDGLGNLFFSDIFNYCVRMVDNTGIIKTVAGNGLSGWGGDGGPANAQVLAKPCGLALDTLGNLYISDAVNNNIRKVSGVANIKQSNTQNSLVFSIYPNPNNGDFSIDYDLRNSSLSGKLVVYDLCGNQVAQFMLSGNEKNLQIHLDGIDPGMYITKLSAGGNCKSSKMSIIQ